MRPSEPSVPRGSVGLALGHQAAGRGAVCRGGLSWPGVQSRDGSAGATERQTQRGGGQVQDSGVPGGPQLQRCQQTCCGRGSRCPLEACGGAATIPGALAWAHGAGLGLTWLSHHELPVRSGAGIGAPSSVPAPYLVNCNDGCLCLGCAWPRGTLSKWTRELH